MKSTENPAIWGVFVGDNGDQLEVFNSKSGPFPPRENSTGYIAIGWPAIGDLRMFRDNYTDFVHKFRMIYDDKSERVFKTKANMPWYFAFEMEKGDWIISPSSYHQIVMVGQIIGDYEADFHDESTLYGKRRPDFVHRREVRWTHIISKGDPRYANLNRIGQLTVSRPQMTFTELRKILDKTAAV